MPLLLRTCAYITFSSYAFILFLSLAYHTKYQTTSCTSAGIFCIAIHILRNFLLKMPLRQILITCLKCSRASCSPSSYSEKIRWG